LLVAQRDGCRLSIFSYRFLVFGLRFGLESLIAGGFGLSQRDNKSQPEVIPPCSGGWRPGTRIHASRPWY